MNLSRRWVVAGAVIVVAGLVGAGLVAREHWGPIPTAALIHSDDVGGAEIRPVAEPRKGLVPRPCADSTLPAPTAERGVQAGLPNGHRAYEYVALYSPGSAAQAAEDLRAAVERCRLHKILALGAAGQHSMLITGTTAYLVGVAGDFLVVVSDEGGIEENGDPAAAADLGARAIRRAGGDTTPAPQPTPGDIVQVQIIGVRPAKDPKSATVTVQLPTCARHPHALNVAEEGELVSARLVADGTACRKTTTATATVTAGTPLGHRVLVLNNESWEPHGDAYRKCGAQGCTPPPVNCSLDVLQAAVPDIPRHADWNLMGCDGTWAVLDINTTAGDCGPSPDCTTEARWQRHFLSYTGGWSTVSGSTAAGCSGIQATIKDFPEELCVRLPAR